VGFEPTIPAFERAKRALDHAAHVIGQVSLLLGTSNKRRVSGIYVSVGKAVSIYAGKRYIARAGKIVTSKFSSRTIIVNQRKAYVLKL
jgi:hypothetical protein